MQPPHATAERYRFHSVLLGSVFVIPCAHAPAAPPACAAAQFPRRAGDGRTTGCSPPPRPCAARSPISMCRTAPRTNRSRASARRPACITFAALHRLHPLAGRSCRRSLRRLHPFGDGRNSASD
ncbi:hypothetical protein BSLA_02f2331 [Burkholderia stabilis]|nr:hypothetical protein BSLA_02f2331 [Burkholderia stabilis]